MANWRTPFRIALVLLPAAAAPAQQAGSRMAALQRSVEQKTSDWEGIAKTLEPRLARMLPCDPRVRAAIEDVAHASDARLAAFSQYLQAAAAQAQLDQQSISKALAGMDLAAREMASGRAEDEQKRIAIEAQLADLSESVKRRSQLADAQKTLASIDAMVRNNGVREHGAGAQQEADRLTALSAALRDLLAASQARERAIRTGISALVLETTRWSDYYAARIARAHTECSITNQAPARPLKRKKQ